MRVAEIGKSNQQHEERNRYTIRAIRKLREQQANSRQKKKRTGQPTRKGERKRGQKWKKPKKPQLKRMQRHWFRHRLSTAISASMINPLLKKQHSKPKRKPI